MCQWDLNKSHTRPAATLLCLQSAGRCSSRKYSAQLLGKNKTSLAPAGIPNGCTQCQHLFCSPQGEFLLRVSGCSTEHWHCIVQERKAASELGVSAQAAPGTAPPGDGCCHRPAAQLCSSGGRGEQRGKVVFGVNEGLMWQHEMLHRVTTRRSEALRNRAGEPEGRVTAH